MVDLKLTSVISWMIIFARFVASKLRLIYGFITTSAPDRVCWHCLQAPGALLPRRDIWTLIRRTFDFGLGREVAARPRPAGGRP